ncbi:MAG: tetratricopeptide repeat protein [Anaerolineae bacterium]|nr:tetratricopeptide repeat protein [Phycisphaerae bacterium]
MNHRVLPLLLRVSAAIITVVAIVIFFFALRAAGVSNRPIVSSLPEILSTPVLMIAAALLLAGLGDLLAHASDTSPEISRNLSRINQSMADLQKRVDDVAVATDRLSRNRAPLPAPPAPPSHVTASLAPGALDPLLKAMAEIRELALLTEDERKQRLANMEQERKRMLVRQVIEHIDGQRWSAGNATLDTIDREHPNDAESKRLRGQFEEARRNAESVTVARGRDQIENYISTGVWDQAYQAARQLVDNFPGNVESQRLLVRVQRERDIHVETSVSRMVEEIRHDIDRRLWRRALQHAQRLVDRFPEHAKTARVNEQLPTLQQNAEIEERQELEVRIQELIRGHKFADAIELSEELLSRFPHSPQAEAIETLLPRIRELASEHREPAAS